MCIWLPSGGNPIYFLSGLMYFLHRFIFSLACFHIYCISSKQVVLTQMVIRCGLDGFAVRNFYIISALLVYVFSFRRGTGRG